MSSKVLSATVLAALMAAPLAVNADSAPGEQKGDWIVRGGFHQLNPDTDNIKPFPGDCAIVKEPRAGQTDVSNCNTLVVDDAVSFTADGTYMFSNHFGVELLLAYPFTHGIDVKPYERGGPLGDKFRIASVDVLPPTAGQLPCVGPALPWRRRDLRDVQW
jgi:outer membrane protein